MKKRILSLFALILFSFGIAAASEGWITDYPGALKTAKEQNKQVLLLFTGSDWCPPCMYMERNVFSSEQFTKLADKEFVRVMLDFPRNKKQSASLEADNEALAQKFSIKGFPTVIVVDASGKEIARHVGSCSLTKLIEWLTGTLAKAAVK